MNYEIVILASAEQDLRELRTYLVNKFGRDIWLHSYEHIKTTIEGLRTHPFIGSLPEALAQLNLTQYRQVLSGMNRIIYEVRQEVVYVHLVVDTRRDMKSTLTRRLLRNWE